MANFYCKWCGVKRPSVMNLLNDTCSKNPNGKRHELYEGSEKSQYTCKWCGISRPSIMNLVNGNCSKSPTKQHEPAL